MHFNVCKIIYCPFNKINFPMKYIIYFITSYFVASSLLIGHTNSIISLSIGTTLHVAVTSAVTCKYQITRNAKLRLHGSGCPSNARK